jgi:hypothetical protein
MQAERVVSMTVLPSRWQLPESSTKLKLRYQGLQAERRAGKAVLHEQLAAREEERQLAAEALMAERAAMAAQARARLPHFAMKTSTVTSSSLYSPSFVLLGPQRLSACPQVQELCRTVASRFASFPCINSSAGASCCLSAPYKRPVRGDELCCSW